MKKCFNNNKKFVNFTQYPLFTLAIIIVISLIQVLIIHFKFIILILIGFLNVTVLLTIPIITIIIIFLLNVSPSFILAGVRDSNYLLLID